MPAFTAVTCAVVSYGFAGTANGSTSRSAAAVASVTGGSTIEPSAASSAISTPMPPDEVTMPSRGPAGSAGIVSHSAAMSSISSIVSALTAPHSASTAS